MGLDPQQTNFDKQQAAIEADAAPPLNPDFPYNRTSFNAANFGADAPPPSVDKTKGE